MAWRLTLLCQKILLGAASRGLLCCRGFLHLLSRQVVGLLRWGIRPSQVLCHHGTRRRKLRSDISNMNRILTFRVCVCMCVFAKTGQPLGSTFLVTGDRLSLSLKFTAVNPCYYNCLLAAQLFRGMRIFYRFFFFVCASCHVSSNSVVSHSITSE
jgi:hypothetical protein